MAFHVIAAAAVLAIVQTCCARTMPISLMVESECNSRACPGLQMLQSQARSVKRQAGAVQAAKCGVVMLAFGEWYITHEAIPAATKIRSFEAASGWCPLDPALRYVPVTIFTDAPDLWQQYPEIDVQPTPNLPRYTNIYEPEPGKRDAKLVHPLALLTSPYSLTIFLDGDAVPCGSTGLGKLMHKLYNSHAAFGAVKEGIPCYHCSDPAIQPTLLSQQDKDEWRKFPEWNGGVLVADTRQARPLLEDWVTEINRTVERAGRDQWGLKIAMFQHRHTLKFVEYGDGDICRYGAQQVCSQGCGVVHFNLSHTGPLAVAAVVAMNPGRAAKSIGDAINQK